MIALSRLLAAPPTPRPVAFDREGVCDGYRLRADVASLAALLAPLAQHRLALYCEDAYAFAVGLLAAAQVGARCLLPPSRQPGALRALAPDVSAFLVDGALDAEVTAGRPCWHPLEAPGGDVPLVALDREAPLVEIFTSGTTRAGRSIEKRVRHLEDEVAVLEAQFGETLGPDTRIVSTVSSQHLYGLLFRVLWPLSAARPLLRTSLLHAAELAAHFDATTPFALVTTPIPLRHLLEKDDLALHGGSCRAVFSSSAPLAASLARRARDVFGSAPVEVYGSTETGGVASRRQQRGGEPWRPLPRVLAARDPADGCLVVTSPFVSSGAAQADGTQRCALGDRVAFDPDGAFQLLGRADRVVKIGDKRLWLPGLEEHLAAHPAVAESVVVPLEHGGETRIGAVVVPTPEGRALVAGGGRRALAKALTEHLAPDFDRVLVPRIWRVVDALPRDAQGKTSVVAVRALFTNAGPATRTAEIVSLQRLRDGVEMRLRIPEDLAFLDGHFPGFPVVAGVVQVHLALGALEAMLGHAPRLSSLDTLKFREILLPGSEVLMRVTLDAEAARFAFELADAERPERVYSSGRGMLEGAA